MAQDGNDTASHYASGNHDGDENSAHGTRKRGKLVGQLERISIRGFKSLKEIDCSLRNLNILVGSNGIGKSNFLGFFKMLGWMVRSGRLQEYIALKGGADDLLFNGGKITRAISCCVVFKAGTGETEYRFTLQHTADNTLSFEQEGYRFTRTGTQGSQWTSLGIGHRESNISDEAIQSHTGAILRRMLRNCSVYQFHDASHNSPLRQPANVDDCVFLRSDGNNLAGVLYDLYQNEFTIYQNITDIIRKVLPNFGSFQLEPLHNKVILKWTQRDNDNKVFPPHLTSDGALRFFALATLLSMPINRISDVILLDEPELGMHPYAIGILGRLIQRLSRQQKQVIVATQSPLLVNQFQPEDIIVAEMEGSATTLKRLASEDLQSWLDEYRVGDLWQKNIFGGNPD